VRPSVGKGGTVTGITLFAGCRPEVAADGGGRILAVGLGARAAAGAGAEIVELSGRTLPGLGDAHLHLGELAAQDSSCRLGGARSLETTLALVRRWSDALPNGAWVLGEGWSEDRWRVPVWPERQALDRATRGRPALLVRRDGHAAWVNSAALAAAGIGAETPNPPGGLIDRGPDGAPSGILRERAIGLVARLTPELDGPALDRALVLALRRLSRVGLTTVHAIDDARIFAALQRLRQRGHLPLRVGYIMPAADLAVAAQLRVATGFGDPWLWLVGVKGFLDGSLGSQTAEMLDGSGVQRLSSSDLTALVDGCRAANLNVCLHAIGDAAVRRALDALAPHAHSGTGWRPRIEHVQCVDPADVHRFHALGVIASMQPLHAVSDRGLADQYWGDRAAHAYAWQPLLAAGARLAFGSDAPVDDPAPLLGIDAATNWRCRTGWYSELAISRGAALAAYTAGVAFAGGTERDAGRLRPGFWCDLTVVERDRVIATVVAGRVVSRAPRG